MATLKHHSNHSREACTGATSKSEVSKGDGLPVATSREPNDVTVAAMEELVAGRGRRFDSVDALLDDLGV